MSYVADVRALARKEVHQILRDPSSIAIGAVLPLILILLLAMASHWMSKTFPSQS